jgi:hypothetical protein
MRKILFSVAVIFLFVIFQNCKSSKTSGFQAPTALSYHKDIVPMLQTSCTPCHFPPEGRKEPLNNYETVKNNISAVIERVKLSKDDPKFMPFKSKKPVLNDSLIAVLETWQKQNMPE